MTSRCEIPLADETLLEYWAGDFQEGAETERVEEHLFECAECSARMESVVSLWRGLSTLVRQGHVSGIISRSLLNRMQRDGVHVRMYSVSAGETVPCAIFPGDDLVVAALRANLTGVTAVALSVTGAGETPFTEIDDVPVSRLGDEVLWATSGALVRQMPSMQLQITMSSAGGSRAVLGQYVLDHSDL